MEIRDVIHGVIEISEAETQIIDAPFFQRLRNIKQLGFAENSYPGATHNRYIHCLGAMHLAGLVMKNIFREKSDFSKKHPDDFERLSQAMRVATMLHDVGHGPLSHTTEFAMPLVEKLRLSEIACIPQQACPFDEPRQADHEDYTQKIILQSSMTPVLERALAPWGIKPLHLACILDERLPAPDSFFVVDGVDYRPLLHQIVSSEVDVDRMDYLTRDSFYAGVSYGKFDLAWLLSNLTHTVRDGKAYLAFGHKALYAFEDFLISRFHMFLMVYFHHKSVIYDEMLGRYLRSADCDYEIPSDIEKYVFFDDYHLYTHLSSAKNPWAKRIFHKNPYKMFAEFHSGIPHGKEAELEQKKLREKVIADLKASGTDYIEKETTGELSKYVMAGGGTTAASADTIFVRYHDKFNPEKFIPLQQCTDLFRRYPESRSITRIYIPN